MSGQRPQLHDSPRLVGFRRKAPVMIRVDDEMQAKFGSYFDPSDLHPDLAKYTKPPKADGREVVKRIVSYMTGERYSANPLYDIVAPYLCFDELFHRYQVRDNVLLMEARRMLANAYAWAIPDPSVLREIVELLDGRPVVEIGAGRGYWAKQLARLGVSVAAYDIEPPGPHVTNPWFNPHSVARGRHRWHPVGRGGTYEARRHADKVLMLCWPLYDDLMAYRALRAYLNAGGETVLYIGEHAGGCCADDKFFELLEKELHMVADMSQHPCWVGIRDATTLWSTEGR